MKDDLPEITNEERQRRVLYSLLRPAVRLARIFSIPLREMVRWFELAYFHELRQVDFTQREAAGLFDVSRRKVAQLAKRLKQNFFKPEREEGLPRRIEFMLWAGPESEGRIHQNLSAYSADEVEEALELLVEQERLVKEEGRTTHYRVPKHEFRLYRDDWLAKIDGLNDHLESVADSVFGRFFEEDDRAFARTLTFRIRDEDLDELRELYESVVFPTLAELDAAARDESDDIDEESTEMRLSMNWAPHQLTERYGDDDEPHDDDE